LICHIHSFLFNILHHISLFSLPLRPLRPLR
jgi:hypothetical protein